MTEPNPDYWSDDPVKRLRWARGTWKHRDSMMRAVSGMALLMSAGGMLDREDEARDYLLSYARDHPEKRAEIWSAINWSDACVMGGKARKTYAPFAEPMEPPRRRPEPPPPSRKG